MEELKSTKENEKAINRLLRNHENIEKAKRIKLAEKLLDESKKPPQIDMKEYRKDCKKVGLKIDECGNIIIPEEQLKFFGLRK